ncbi:GNAT family N-acetyltransferase [Lutibacter sp. TH_r2]|uniref:GNAT family N-acetyltransferase n=1 Tax=Lutibacter sp. TH_r2 TaxID=3082083 RepID=UPI0029544A09|nr:GNAT family N-acetyltransferase [Lutibacter sp. TH_r2]MDV7187488.1 GNAT family N-acetyltransferase [Lutibacter sp. TH_r2]
MIFRKARIEDVSSIVKIIASDSLGKLREDYQEPLPEKYYEAFKIIDADTSNELIVVEDKNTSAIIGTLQLTFIQYLAYQGGLRVQIENVFINESFRGKGIGKKLFEWAIARAKEKNAHIVQLTSDKKRPKAIKFYTNLGFKATHEGFKLHI